MEVVIGDRIVGPGHPCFITFEIGPTHNGIESAKRLVSHAVEAGADAVKFQMLDPERLISDKQQTFTYSILRNRQDEDLETIEESLYDLLKRRSLTEPEWRELKQHCDKCGVEFFATAGFPDEIRLLQELECTSIKIASADINHTQLLKQAAETGMCVQLDTGMSSLAEIEQAVRIIVNEGNRNIIIHQCPSGYPARLEGINLRLISTLKAMFPFPVAFSDHSPGSQMDIAALALGVNLLEKTITEDRTTPSVEHVMSLEPNEMKSFVELVRNMEIALGNGMRHLSDSEIEKRAMVRRSAFLKAPARKGSALKECNIEFRRPGNSGLAPEEIDNFHEAKLNADLTEGHNLSLKDLTWD